MAEDKIDYKAITKAEWAKCCADPIYFMKKYVYIQAKGGRQLFTLYTFQEKLLRLIQKNEKVMILKSRQLGITTLCAGYCLWLMIFFNDQSVLALAPDTDKAKAIISKIRFAYDELPGWLKQGAEKVLHNTTTLELKNGSKAQAVSGAAKSSRSKSANFVILDEAAFIDNAEELWGSAQQTLATHGKDGKAIVLSTPNGVGNWFHQFWVSAENNENNFIPVALPWHIHPDRDQKWRNDTEKELGKKLAAQECDCVFTSSGNTFIDSEDLDFYSSKWEDPVEMRGITKDYWIWKYPHEVKNCMVIVDTSKGDGGDNAGIQVIEVMTGDQVAEFKGQMEPKELAKLAVTICIEYNSALLIIENTGIGEATVSYAKESGYSNLYFSPKGDTTDLSQYLDKFNNTDPDKMVAGFPTTTKTRPLLLHAFRQYVMDRYIKLRSKRLYSELSTFIWKNGKAQAASGYHDDLIMPYAIGMYLRDTAIEFQSRGVNMQRALLDNIKKNTQFAASYTSNNIAMKPYQMMVGNQVEDISWVLGGGNHDW